MVSSRGTRRSAVRTLNFRTCRLDLTCRVRFAGSFDGETAALLSGETTTTVDCGNMGYYINNFYVTVLPNGTIVKDRTSCVHINQGNARTRLQPAPAQR
jgi:hypothetical protein